MNKFRKVATQAYIDLGLPNALDLAVKAEAVIHIREKMEEQSMSQAALARLVGWAPSRISDLLRGKLDRFSMESINQVLCHFGGQLRAELWVQDKPKPKPKPKPQHTPYREKKQKVA